MRRFPSLAAALLLTRAGFFVGAVGLSAVLGPILLNSCQNVQPEEAPLPGGAAVEPDASGTESSATDPSPGTTRASASDARSGQRSTGLQGTSAKPDLTGVARAASTDQAGTSGPSAPISAATRRTARGLPDAVQGYPSWSALGDPDGLVVPQSTDDECRAYVDLPLGVEATIGERLQLPLERRTMIVIESKRAGDDFIRRIDTLTRGDPGWELRCFVREQPTESFEEESADGHPDDAACRKLLRSLAEGNADLILGE